MRIHTLFVIAAALALSLPLSAGHRHGRDCGHVFDSHRGNWISVQFGTPFGFGVVNRGFNRARHFDRYDGRYYQDSRRFKHNKKFYKKLRKQRLRDHRQFRFQRHHVHGPQCW